MTAAKAASMIRLGDTYCALALNPSPLSTNAFVLTKKHGDPHCKKCGRKMQLTHSLPRTRVLPAMQAFRCDHCGETQIWKGASPSVRSPQRQRNHALAGAGTRYVAVSFRRAGKDFAPGPAIECPDAALAVQRADLMVREDDIAGAVAFSRRSDSTSGEVDDAVVLEVFGAIPEDLDIA